MIIVKQARIKDGQRFPMDDKTMTVFQALEFMIKYEFAFGTIVTDMTGQSVTLSTTIMGCTDITIFEGIAGQIRWINQAAAAYTLIRSQMYQPKFRDAMVNKIQHVTNGHPAMMEACTTFLAGGTFVKGTLLALLLEDDATLLQTLTKFSDAELMTMLEWKVVDNLPLSEIIQLAA